MDTAPDIFINFNDKAFHKKLDTLYGTLIRPAFESALKKQILSTELDLYPEFPAAVKSDIFSSGDAICEIVVDSDVQFYYQLSQENTSICRDLLFQMVETEDVSPKHLRLGKYMLT